MKLIILKIALLICYSISSQELSESKIYTLNNLNISTSKLNLKDSKVQKNLNRILVLDKKQKKNKTVAIVFSSIAVSGIILGGILV